MSNCLQTEIFNKNAGLDYIFARMSAIYGATFLRHWEGIDASLVRKTWSEILGDFLQDKKKMDFALENMDSKFPPSALEFRSLCKACQIREETVHFSPQKNLEYLDKEKNLERLKELKIFMENLKKTSKII